MGTGVRWTGLLLIWALVFRSTVADGTDILVNITSGESQVITSPSYPSNYPDLANCTYYISGPDNQVLYVQFTAFSINTVSSCDTDYLILYDGATTSAGKLDTLCGEELPGLYCSSGSEITMVFISDASNNSTGFSIRVFAVETYDFGTWDGGQSPNTGETIQNSAPATSNDGYLVVLPAPGEVNNECRYIKDFILESTDTTTITIQIWSKIQSDIYQLIASQKATLTGGRTTILWEVPFTLMPIDSTIGIMSDKGGDLNVKRVNNPTISACANPVLYNNGTNVEPGANDNLIFNVADSYQCDVFWVKATLIAAQACPRPSIENVQIPTEDFTCTPFEVDCSANVDSQLLPGNGPFAMFQTTDNKTTWTMLSSDRITLTCVHSSGTPTWDFVPEEYGCFAICKVPSVGSFVSFTTQDEMSGVIRPLSCEPGYTSTDPSTSSIDLTCDLSSTDNYEWIPSNSTDPFDFGSFNCEQIFCSPGDFDSITGTSLEDPIPVQIPTFGAEATQALMCDVGYNTTESPHNAICKQNSSNPAVAFWEYNPCEIVDCGTPPAAGTNVVETHSATTFGSNVTYSCESGYRGDPVTFSCNEDGDWKVVQPTCTLITCSDVDNSTVDVAYGALGPNDEKVVNTTVEVMCKEGYFHHPSGQISTCNDTGDWFLPVFACEEVLCESNEIDGDLSTNLVNVGTPTFPTIGSNASQSLTCADGYESGGSLMATCQVDGNNPAVGAWSYTSCTGKDCGTLVPSSGVQLDDPDAITNLVDTLYDSESTEINYTCKDGYETISGSAVPDSVTCALSQTDTVAWTPWDCQAKSCMNLSTLVMDSGGKTVVTEITSLSDVSVTYDNGTTDVVVGTDYNCNTAEGFYTNTSMENVTCALQANKSVEWSPWQCAFAVCEEPDRVFGGSWSATCGNEFQCDSFLECRDIKKKKVPTATLR